MPRWSTVLHLRSCRRGDGDGCTGCGGCGDDNSGDAGGSHGDGGRGDDDCSRDEYGDGVYSERLHMSKNVRSNLG